jgi:hypothetical protein
MEDPLDDSGVKLTSTHLTVLSRDPNNFETWLIDMRAHLRSRKLWTYTQEECKSQGKEKEKWEAAADAMTPFIKADIKKELKEEEFNDGYKMMTRLRSLLQPTGEAEFMRLCKEYYSLSYKVTDMSINEFLTRVKLLEDRMDATKIELTGDRRTLLCLSMAFIDNPEYRSLIQIWSITPDMTADRARAMLQEEDKRIQQSEHTFQPGTRTFTLATRPAPRPQSRPRHYGSLGLTCQWCGRDGHEKITCWDLHPHLKPEKYKAENGFKPEWFRERLRRQGEQLVNHNNNVYDEDNPVPAGKTFDI